MRNSSALLLSATFLLTMLCSTTPLLAQQGSTTSPAPQTEKKDPAPRSWMNSPSLEEMLEMSWFLPGQELRESPDNGSEVLTLFEGISLLPVSAEQGPWQQVTFHGHKGWIDTRWQIPWDRRHTTLSKERRNNQPLRAPDRKRLKIAKNILGTNKPARTFGSMDVYTDLEDENLLDLFEKAVAITPDAYFARYGRRPLGKLRETIIIFSSNSDYSEYIETADIRISKKTLGHAGGGTIALWVDPHAMRYPLTTLIHEVTHLLNDHSLAREVQPWLEEGMASNLGDLWIEKPPEYWRKGLQLGHQDLDVIDLYRRAELGNMPGIGALSAVDRGSFSNSKHTGTAYAHAGILVRYLANHPQHSENFRRYLSLVSSHNYRGNMGLLLETLGTDFESLDQEFRLYDRGHR